MPFGSRWVIGATTWHVVRRRADIRQDTTIAHRTATHTLGHHPLPDPQLSAARTPAVPMARGVGKRCTLGHASTSVRRLRGLRRPRPRCHARPRGREPPPAPPVDDNEHRPGEPLPRQPTHRARDTTEFESNHDVSAISETASGRLQLSSHPYGWRRGPAGRRPRLNPWDRRRAMPRALAPSHPPCSRRDRSALFEAELAGIRRQLKEPRISRPKRAAEELEQAWRGAELPTASATRS